MTDSDGGQLRIDYCAGLLTIQGVADKHGVKKTTLIDMAKRLGWVRKKKPSKTATKKIAQKKISRSSGREKKQSEITDDDGTTLSIDPDEYGITVQQAWFAYWFTVTKSRVEAYRKAGYTCQGNTAYAAASRLYRDVKVRRAIRDQEARTAKRYEADLDQVINQLMAIINADPNALSQYRRVNCRFCWGEKNHYQWRDLDEQLKAEKKAETDKKPPVDLTGGIGFVENMDPNPDCPRCQGEGIGETFYSDTRDLDGDALHYFAGVKESKFGIEILTEDKKAARIQLMQLLNFRRTERAQALDLQRLQLANEKLRAEINNLKQTGGDETIIVHNALKPPGSE
ncbi:MAG: terminase small subunit [Serratia sp. (in: enterobacteria)]|uniref:terminase small subunit n=1 Tax=Serratia sp. (in: enterobacteria) TaxID=616 RepID=UPI003F40F492